MAADTLAFVDSIAASPTVRLNVNDGTTWVASADGMDFSPPPLRRAINGTLLTDGSVMSASSYDNRVLTLSLEVTTASIDATATQIQTLNRELDRDGNYLKWQPNGATAPVFFRTLRSPATRAHAVGPVGIRTRLDVQILAEPFALGLREDVAVGTVNNDPAAGSNGLFFDVTGVKGDVAAPVVIKDATKLRAYGILGCRQHGTPSDLVFFGQCESMSLGTDTTNPGGAADAAMSGTGTTNYARTSFATTAPQATRITWVMGGTTAQRLAQVGTYRVFLCLRRSDNTSVITVANANANPISNVTVPLTTARQLVDIGLWYPTAGPVNPGRYGADAPIVAQSLQIYAARTSGAGTLDWDFILLVPADEQLMLWDAYTDDTHDGIIDSMNESVYTDDTNNGAIFGGTVGTYPGSLNAFVSGGYPYVKPNQTNRFVQAWATSTRSTTGLQHDKTKTGSLTVSYWPRYLYVRPAST